MVQLPGYTGLITNLSFLSYSEVGTYAYAKYIRNILKKAETENSDIFISGKETGYWVECLASSEIFQKIQIPITKP